MVVLRISDYIHITPDRAPITGLQILPFASPVSILEWNLHQTIKDINKNHEDPETLFINARPGNSVELLKLKELFNNIQGELDLSWAILGEVYGRYKGLNQLKISIRRVRSNLENRRYMDSLPYLSEKVIFDCDPEVIKLLVSPLYGGDPSYGVRELIQNAADACRELNYYYSKRSEGFEYIPEIKVAVIREGSDYYFQIEDNGFGMSAEVIIHYFVRAGASYRNSNEWKMNYIANGATQVARSGRFGVGVFAAFLLGEQIEVTTKNIDSNKGYSFTASLDDVQIEVSNTIDRSVGTTIKIKLDEKSMLELKNHVENDYRSPTDEPAWFAWYVLNEPVINYVFPDDWGRDGFNKYHTIIDVNDWREIETYGYGKALWKFEGVSFIQFFRSTLICNGIIIPSGYESNHYYRSYPSMNESPPVVVFDNEGTMPLTLTRDKLNQNGTLPFENELFKSLILDMVATLIKLKMNTNKITNNTTHFSHPILRFEEVAGENGQGVRHLYGEGTLVLSRKGYCLPYTRNINKMKTNKITQIWLRSSNELTFNLWSYLEYAMISNQLLSDSIDKVKNELYDSSFIHDFRIESKRIYLPKKLGFALINGEVRMRKDVWNKLRIEKELDRFVCIVMNNPPPSTMDDTFFETENGLKIDTLIEIYIAPKKFRNYSSYDKEKIKILNAFVEDVLNNCFADEVFIPYRIEDRKERFPQAFEFLSKYI